MKNSKLFLVLFVALTPLFSVDGGDEALVIPENDSSINQEGQPSEEQIEKYGNGQNGDDASDFDGNDSFNQQSGSLQGGSGEPVSFDGDQNTTLNQPIISGGNLEESSITSGGDNVGSQEAVAGSVERGLPPLGKWRDNVEKLFKGWGDNVKQKVNQAFEYASERANNTLGRFSGSQGEGPSHRLEVTVVHTDPDKNTIERNSAARSQVEFGTKAGSPRRGLREWFNDTFGRGTTRKQVQALETKADELEQQIRTATSLVEHNQALREMGVVLDQLEMSRRNLHRSWWSWGDSKTTLQKSQEGKGNQTSAKRSYFEALNKRIDALRDILLTSGDLGEGLLKNASVEALEKAAQVAGDEGDEARQNAIQQELVRRKETEENKYIEEASSKKLLDKIDKMLADGSYKNSEYFKKLRSELKTRSQGNIFGKTMYPTDDERWNELQNIFNSDSYNNDEDGKGFTFEKWEAEKREKKAEAERVRQEQIKQAQERERQWQEEYARQRAAVEQQEAERARQQEEERERQRQEAENNARINESIARIKAQNASLSDIASNERMQSGLYGNGSRDSFNDRQNEQPEVQKRKAQAAEEQEEADRKQAEIDRQVEGITTGNWSEPPVFDDDNVSQGSGTSTGSSYTPDTENQLALLNQLEVPTSEQEAAYKRAESKIDSYASGKRTKTRKSRTQKGFEDKYFNGLTELQKEQLRIEFMRRKDLANQQKEERRARGVRGALRGAKKIQEVARKGFNPLESGAYQ